MCSLTEGRSVPQIFFLHEVNKKLLILGHIALLCPLFSFFLWPLLQAKNNPFCRDLTVGPLSWRGFAPLFYSGGQLHCLRKILAESWPDDHRSSQVPRSIRTEDNEIFSGPVGGKKKFNPLPKSQQVRPVFLGIKKRKKGSGQRKLEQFFRALFFLGMNMPIQLKL